MKNPRLSGREFNGYCEKRLEEYNRRDTKAIARHIESLLGILRQEGGEVLQIMFGGSVQKRTDLNGLSDVDVLLIVNESSLVNRPPAEVICHVRDTIKGRMHELRVSTGKLAVTVSYSDGNEIQILPAIRTNTGVRIAEPGSTKWSGVVQPDRFVRKLTEVNQANDGRVVPVIKLAKAIADRQIPRPNDKITGYHIESLAIEAFRNYRGPSDPKSMLNHLFVKSSKAVMNPIKDSTGQSRHVDEYLEPAGSKSRRRASENFQLMRTKINSCKDKKEFDNLF